MSTGRQNAYDTLLSLDQISQMLGKDHELRCLKHDERSAVFQAVWQNQAILIKQYFGHDASAQAQNAFDETTSRLKQFAGSEFNVAEPITVLPDLGIFISKFIFGDRVDQIINNGTNLEKRSVITEAGRWLALYSNDRIMTETFDVGHWLRRMKRMQTKASNPAHLDLMINMTKIMQAQRDVLKSSQIRHARTHGDFHPPNLIQTDRQLVGIDIENSGYLPLVKDAAQFIVRSYMLDPEKTGFNEQGMPSEIAKAFTRGFMTLEPIETDILLPFFYTWELARVVVMHLNTSNVKNKRSLKAAEKLVSTYR